MSTQKGALPFSIEGNGLNFKPTYLPNRIQLNKERNLVRHANFCGLEDVFEIHGKNRELHISGILLENEKSAFRDVLDHNQRTEIITPGWSGYIRIVKGEHEGPIAWDPQEQQYQWEYSIDVLSTGESEGRHISRYNDGIISDGSSSGIPSMASLTREQRDLFSGRNIDNSEDGGDDDEDFDFSGVFID